MPHGYGHPSNSSALELWNCAGNRQKGDHGCFNPCRIYVSYNDVWTHFFHYDFLSHLMIFVFKRS